MVTDPVCGMQIDERKGAGTSVYHGQTHYFCSNSCKAAFDKEPQKYAEHAEHAHGH